MLADHTRPAADWPLPNDAALAHSEALAASGSIPAPLSAALIADSIDPSHLQRYVKGERK